MIWRRCDLRITPSTAGCRKPGRSKQFLPAYGSARGAYSRVPRGRGRPPLPVTGMRPALLRKGCSTVGAWLLSLVVYLYWLERSEKIISDDVGLPQRFWQAQPDERATVTFLF